MVDAITVSYLVSFVALLAGVGVCIALLVDDTIDNETGQFAWLLVIPGFAALSYAIMAADLFVVGVNGNDVYLFRYIDWLVTTPILVGYVGYVAGAPRKWIVGVALADAAMIVIGLGATLVTGIATWIGFGVSAGFHAVLLGILYTVFPKYAEQYPERYRLFKVLQNHVGLLWIAYPVVWLLSPAGLGTVSVLGTAMVIAYLDAVAKTPYVYFVYRERSCFASDRTVREEDDTTTIDTPTAGAD